MARRTADQGPAATRPRAAPQWRRARFPWVSLLAEAIGTFFYIFLGVGVVLTQSYQALIRVPQLGTLEIALVNGLALAVLVSCLGHLSGGYYNPALSVALAVCGRLHWGRALGYVYAQCAGGILASELLQQLFSVEVWRPVRLGMLQLGPGVDAWSGTGLEALLTGFIVFALLGACRQMRESGNAVGASLGAATTCTMLLAGPLTGGALNPVRAFGPAVVSGSFDHLAVYWVGPLLGAFVAAALYRFGLQSRKGDG